MVDIGDLTTDLSPAAQRLLYRLRSHAQARSREAQALLDADAMADGAVASAGVLQELLLGHADLTIVLVVASWGRRP